jgi:uncharacterized protein (DUF1499 family)
MKKGSTLMTITLIIIVLFLAINFGRIYFQNAQVPQLGVNNGQLAPISKKPNNVSTQTEDAEKKVPTLPFKATPEATMNAIKAAVAGYGGGKIQQETNDYLYVVFTTSLMKYHDDVEFWLDTENKEVHFRSSSRAGYSDMGLNRKRWEALAELYRAQ